MSALTVDHSSAAGQEWDDLVRIWEQTDAPEGCKVEIIEGIVTVAPPPAWEHNDAADEVQRVLYGVIPRDWAIYQNLGLTVPERKGAFVPDLVVIPKAAPRGEKGYSSAGEARLVVEITSRSNANHDRVEKLRAYATAAVPLYLLLDAWHSGKPTATLYGQPKNGLYRVLDTVAYDNELPLPEPFNITLDTSLFPVA
ncbi:Uma2 family endonuclease [Streptomyces zagrosensis]|uniref:Uma2 family endonuclease n=1 Tax=Streptomyces zagrosensis TaxID=1042984 RepID=A0A7W9Q780_9ACTN|nr:Uma2 family endonuclease [Streptomyces zagrosensis]MBB5934840.1 Uma2 family endonuclease [Streptomyces zagrosensis]